MVECRRVRIDLGAIRWPILCDLASLRIELTDVTPGNRGEPDVAIFIGDQSVRSGVGRLQIIFLKLASLWIEAAQLVRGLPRIPERTVRSDCGIVRPRLRRRHLVLLDAYVQCSDRLGA